jgi:hypothetical protein
MELELHGTRFLKNSKMAFVSFKKKLEQKILMLTTMRPASVQNLNLKRILGSPKITNP